VQRLREAGMPDEGMLEIARVLGQGMSALAATIRRVLADAYLAPGDTELDTALRYADAVEHLRPELGPLLEFALAVHQEEQIGSEVVGRTERAAGRLAGASEICVAFADLVGFTRIGEEVAPANLGVIAGRFTDLAVETARSPVRLVKMIGDAALLVSPDADRLLTAALDLMDAVEAADDLPALRIGIARGQAINRGGEWFGTPVNMASKVTGLASPGQILATTELRDAATRTVAWTPVAPRWIESIGRPLELLEVRLPPGAVTPPWPDYDSATVAEIRRTLAGADGRLGEHVAAYERRHKCRKGVLHAAAHRFSEEDDRQGREG
jgi:adenylate cyclase